ncbi:uncharacterized protein UDID_17560 [Ustilago sp. UG-2017a]|nr:uncharacterized protein UDID_17560 [Ustilago sp. UG-2017a]
MTLKIAKNHKRGLLEFRGDTWQESAMATSAPLFEGVDEEFEHIKNEPKVSKQRLWHEHPGHPGRDKTKAITSKLKDKYTMKLDPNTALTCEQCLRSKSTSARMGKGSGERAIGPLDLIHVDLIIDLSHVTEYTCTLVLVDDHSNNVWQVAGMSFKAPTSVWLSGMGKRTQNEGPLQEYMDMETDSEERLSGGTAEVMEQGSTAETQIDSKFFGLVATRPEWRKNLDPTIHEAMSGEDRKHWEEAMQKELDGLEAMGMWEIADLPKGANTVDTRWVLKIKTDANLVLTKFKARLVARGFTQCEGINYTEVFAPVAPIQSI